MYEFYTLSSAELHCMLGSQLYSVFHCRENAKIPFIFGYSFLRAEWNLLIRSGAESKYFEREERKKESVIVH